MRDGRIRDRGRNGGTDVDKVRKMILKAAIMHYGRGNQQLKAIEELAELIRALARGDDSENVAEEMADVRIMLDQLEIMFGNCEDVRRIELEKLDRLNRRLHAAEVVGEESPTTASGPPPHCDGEARGTSSGASRHLDAALSLRPPLNGKAFGETARAKGKAFGSEPPTPACRQCADYITAMETM